MIALLVIGIGLVLFYALCSRLAYKATFDYYQSRYGSVSTVEENKREARFIAWFGPWGLGNIWFFRLVYGKRI